MKSMTDGVDKFHIAMFPWLAFGHIIPYLEFSKLIAKKGHKTYFISIPKNIDRLPKLPLEYPKKTSPDWVIHDFAPYWLAPITTRLGISRGINAWFLAILGLRT